MTSKFPTAPAPDGFVHAWWSDRGQCYGTSIYARENGDEVEICQVTKEHDAYQWPDRQYLGLVRDFDNGGFVRIGKRVDK